MPARKLVSGQWIDDALTWSRRLATAITTEPDWTPVANETTPSGALTAAASLLENETWTKAFTYDALSRVTSATLPDSSALLPSYNEAGLLGSVDVKIRGASTASTFVDDIDYDAHGRRTRIEYGNTTATEYSYDELTFRLTRIKTTRSTDNKVLQDLKYTYDPVGNIVEVHDDAHEDVFYNDAQVEPTGQYEYDPIYRLTRATGREHAGGVGDVQRDQNDLPLWNLPHPNNAAALRRYVEEYTYDKVGNILEFAHVGVGGPSGATWTRTYRYDTGVTSGYTNNRLHSTSEPGSAWANYTHDANGNMVAMPHLAAIAYTHRDQMHHADLGGGGDAYYTYDGSGERVRKFIQRNGTTTEERIYLGGWELYRKRVGTAQDIEVERETLHVMDDTRRIAMVETLTIDDEEAVSVVVSRVRYQYGNHLDSAMLECDDAGDVISYEEYHPYGTAAYRSAKSGVEVSERRYRYTGKERDDETGLSYHQWRYYAPWLARWTTADPAAFALSGDVRPDQSYVYVGDRPIVAVDLNGQIAWGIVAVVAAAIIMSGAGVASGPRNQVEAKKAPRSVSGTQFAAHAVATGVSLLPGGGVGAAVLKKTGSRILAGVVGGAIDGAISAPAQQGVSDAFDGKPSDGWTYGKQAATGAAVGGGLGLLTGAWSRLWRGPVQAGTTPPAKAGSSPTPSSAQTGGNVVPAEQRLADAVQQAVGDAPAAAVAPRPGPAFPPPRTKLSVPVKSSPGGAPAQAGSNPVKTAAAQAKPQAASQSAAPETTRNTFELIDGVRRTKAAQICGHSDIEGEIVDVVTGRTVATERLPISSILSPKPVIDTASFFPKNLQRWLETLRLTAAGSKPAPIMVKAGGSGTPIEDVRIGKP